MGTITAAPIAAAVDQRGWVSTAGGCSATAPVRSTRRLRWSARFGKGLASGFAALAFPARAALLDRVPHLKAMATPSAPSCEIRRVIVHFYPDGLKGGAHPCEQRFFGKRGKPVKKMRFVPAEKAFAIARKLQGTRGYTVSVI
jgi:hypothetical protein